MNKHIVLVLRSDISELFISRSGNAGMPRIEESGRRRAASIWFTASDWVGSEETNNSDPSFPDSSCFGLAHLAPPFWFAQTFRSGYTVQLLNLRGDLEARQCCAIICHKPVVTSYIGPDLHLCDLFWCLQLRVQADAIGKHTSHSLSLIYWTNESIIGHTPTLTHFQI